MALTALNPKTMEVICSLDYEDDIRNCYSDWRLLVSPFSPSTPLRPVTQHFRKSSFVRQHFRELNSDATSMWDNLLLPDSEYCKEGKEPGTFVLRRERLEHIEGKIFVQRNAKTVFDAYLFNAECHLEYRLPVGDRYRIIDVAFVYPCGLISAHEVQLASITPKDLEARTQDYLGQGVDVVWWFGLEAATNENILWHKDRLQVPSPILEFKYDGG